MPPIIAITAGREFVEGKSPVNELSDAYVRAILDAGGIPVILPSITLIEQVDRLFARVDGFLFTGGADADPILFNGRPHERVYGIDHERDAIEINILKKAAVQGKPFMGICRGIQMVNIALGGTLWTDIHDQYGPTQKHDFYPGYARDYIGHVVSLVPGSRLEAIVGAGELEVNSFHHQAIEVVAPGLTAMAFSPDGLVEAVMLEGHPFGLGVQWHPECLPQYPRHRALFKAFVQATGG